MCDTLRLQFTHECTNACTSGGKTNGAATQPTMLPQSNAHSSEDFVHLSTSLPGQLRNEPRTNHRMPTAKCVLDRPHHNQDRKRRRRSAGGHQWGCMHVPCTRTSCAALRETPRFFGAVYTTGANYNIFHLARALQARNNLSHCIHALVSHLPPIDNPIAVGHDDPVLAHGARHRDARGLRRRRAARVLSRDVASTTAT